jgi:(p)ppGpp synthase/HD superfamily hydrolase
MPDRMIKGENYILHPLRVILSMENELQRICGILHDVVEYSVTTFDDLKMRVFPKK